MSKKRGKSSAGQAGAQKWEQALVTTPFCEEGAWNATIAYVVGEKLDDYRHIEQLASAVNSGLRRFFSIITKDELYEQVKEMGNPKGKKPKEIPQYYEVCEPCKTYLDNEEDIPLPLLSKLIKFALLNVKRKDQKQREADKKAEAGKGKSGKKGDKGGKDRAKSAKGKGGGKKSPDPPSGKTESKLRKRGEEDLDHKYIDDEPDDGPQHYVMLCGFHHPHLLSYLTEVGVTIDSVIKIKSQPQPSAEDSLSDVPHTDDQAPPSADQSFQDPSAEVSLKDEKTLALEEAERVMRKNEEQQLAVFWQDVLVLMQSAPPQSSLHDVAMLQYVVSLQIIPTDPLNQEEQVEFGTDLFEDVACMMYDLLDAKRQWRNYLDHLKLLTVPVKGQPAPLHDQKDHSQRQVTPGATAMSKPDTVSQPDSSEESSDVDMRLYTELVQVVPEESVSVAVVLHCMLEQVVAWEEETVPPSQTPAPPHSDGLENSLAQHLTSAAYSLALSEEQKELLATDFDPLVSPAPASKQPLLMSYHDDIADRLDHVKALDVFDAVSAEEAFLSHSPVASLPPMPRPSQEGAHARAARLQQLMHFSVTGGLTQLEVEHALQQFVLECAELTAVHPDGSVIPGSSHQQRDIPWDHPYPYYTSMIPTEDEVAAEEEPPVITPEPLSSQSPTISQVSSSDDFGPKSPSSDADSRPSSKESKGKGRGRSRKKKRGKSATIDEVPVCPVTPPVSEEDLSRPGSGGILKTSRSPSASRSASRSHSNVSVRFEKEAGDEEGSDVGGSLPPDLRSVDMENDAQQRCLDQWCFAEHHKPNILLQVMSAALATHPYIDTYYEKRTDRLMVVLSNPHSPVLQSRTAWHAQLHSSLGFRNYMELVAASIEDWTTEQEAKYAASQLESEVKQIVKDAEAASTPTSTKKNRSKSPKKSPSRGRNVSTERESSANPLVRQGTIKAWKEEQDKLAAEEEEKERQRQEKRDKSAQKKGAKEPSEKPGGKGKRPGSQNSTSKSRAGKDEAAEKLQNIEEPQWAFTGYDVERNVLHAMGELFTMFPADGGQIRTEKTEFIQGTVHVKSSVVKDGHCFVVHIVDPKSKADEELTVDEEAEREKQSVEDRPSKEGEEGLEAEQEDTSAHDDTTEEPHKPVVGSFGSFSATYSDGLSLAFSSYGSSGQADEGGKYQPAPYIPPSPAPATPTGKESVPPKGKKDKKSSTPDPSTVEDEKVEVESEVEPVPHQPFQQLRLSCPDGLCITYCLESSMGVHPDTPNDRRLLVKQSYPIKSALSQECQASRKNAMQEMSRVIDNKGTVITTSFDGAIKVMYADGRVSELCEASPWLEDTKPADQTTSTDSKVEQPHSKKSQRKSGSRSGKKHTEEAVDAVEEEPNKKGIWITTMPSGERTATRLSDGTQLPVRNAKFCVARDPLTKQSMHTRDDHVILVYYPDGSCLVEHSDGTRITTTTTDVPNEKPSNDAIETGEASASQAQPLVVVMVECPGFATVKIDASSGRCSTELGSKAFVHTTSLGSYDVYHQDGSCLHIEEDGTAVYFPKPNPDVEMLNPNQHLQYVMKHNDSIICETMDNMGNTFSVANDGGTQVVLAGEKVTSPGGQYTSYKQHAPRFFIINKDGSGTELLRYQDIAEFIAQAEDDLTSAILMDPLPDYPGVVGITVLRPHLHTPSDRWLTSYQLDTIVPSGLSSRDLDTLPPREAKTEGPVFGGAVGRGVAVGSIVRPPPAPPVVKCPNKLQVRQLLQYRPVSDQLRDKLGASLRQYADHVKSQRQQTEAMRVMEPRTEEELSQAAALLTSTATVTALPEDVKGLYEKMAATREPTPSAPAVWKRQKAGWESDAHEMEEEQRCRRALQQHDVPKYFDSELGKQFLLSQAPDMNALSQQLARDTLNPQSEPPSEITAESEQTSDSPNSTIPASQASANTPSTTNPDFSPCPLQAGNGTSPPGLRPGNPTPAHATGQCSPAPLRPTNPTPAHAIKTVPDRPEAPTPKEAGGDGQGSSSSQSPPTHEPPPPCSFDEGEELVPSAESDLILTRSLAYNVLGEPRSEEVHVPAYLKTGRPGASPNHKFAAVEDPIRRKTNTLSITGATNKGRQIQNNMRGFELLPQQVAFGVLREGSTYSYKVHLKNTGLDPCRFRIKQAPPSTGISVHYQPGMVAAGMKTEIEVEIFAMAVEMEGGGEVGNISHSLDILTETHHLLLPIQATVLTAHDYDNRDQRSGGKAAGVTLVSRKPPGGIGIIRPCRQNYNQVSQSNAEKVC